MYRWRWRVFMGSSLAWCVKKATASLILLIWRVLANRREPGWLVCDTREYIRVARVRLPANKGLRQVIPIHVSWQLSLLAVNRCYLLPIRDLDWGCLPESLVRMDANVEPTRTYLRRLSGRQPQFRSRCRIQQSTSCIINLFNMCFFSDNSYQFISRWLQ